MPEHCGLRLRQGVSGRPSRFDIGLDRRKHDDVDAAGLLPVIEDAGGFGGLYAGVSLDKNIPFGDDGLSVQEMFSFAAGYDMYRLDITDQIVADGLGGLLALNDTNTFSYSGGVPTLKLDASIGIGTSSWMAGVYAGVSVGKTALISYERLDDGQNPQTSLAPELGFSIGVNFTGRF